MSSKHQSTNNVFVCNECNFTSASHMGLSQHIKHHHGKKYYYDKWLKLESEDSCEICKKPTSFISIAYGYKKTCGSKECINQLKSNNNITKHGVSNTFQLDKVKQTIQSNNKKYGVDHVFQRPYFQSKSKNTNNKKYGVDYPTQNSDIFNKGLKTRKAIAKYKNTNLWYQGSYELDFLERYYNKFNDIQRGKTIKYTFNELNKIYYPDFYIPSLNLIIEIKSSWTHHKNQDLAKQTATIHRGFHYIMILDKNYLSFDTQYCFN